MSHWSLSSLSPFPQDSPIVLHNTTLSCTLLHRTHCTLNTLHTAYTEHSTYCTLHTLNTQQTAHCLHCTLNTLHNAYTDHSTDCTLHTNALITALFCSLHSAQPCIVVVIALLCKLHSFSHVNNGTLLLALAIAMNSFHTVALRLTLAGFHACRIHTGL